MNEFLEVRILRQKRHKLPNGGLVMFKYVVYDYYVLGNPKDIVATAARQAEALHHGAWYTIRRMLGSEQHLYNSLHP